MDGFEWNKIAAAVLIAGLVGMIAGKVSDGLYLPAAVEKRGYEVEGAEEFAAGAGGAAVKKEPIPLGALIAAGSVDAGIKVAKKCATCHSFTKGGEHRVGPNLYGSLGGKIAGKSGFDYSPALKAVGGKWTVEQMYSFLRSPKKAVKGTKMAFAGLRKPEDIANMIVYLRSLGGSAPLPPKDFQIQP